MWVNSFTVASPFAVAQLHHIWLETLLTQGASSFPLFRLHAATIFFLMPEFQNGNICKNNKQQITCL